jgi:hypothetical protein
LLTQKCSGAEGVAAMQGDRVIENMQCANHAGSPCSMTLRRKASNIRMVQMLAL